MEYWLTTSRSFLLKSSVGVVFGVCSLHWEARRSHSLIESSAQDKWQVKRRCTIAGTWKNSDVLCLNFSCSTTPSFMSQPSSSSPVHHHHHRRCLLRLKMIIIVFSFGFNVSVSGWANPNSLASVPQQRISLMVNWLQGPNSREEWCFVSACLVQNFHSLLQLLQCLNWKKQIHPRVYRYKSLQRCFNRD